MIMRNEKERQMADFPIEKQSKSFLLNETLQKILNLINITVILTIIVISFVAITDGGTFLMSRVEDKVIDRFIQANPDLLNSISKRIDKQTAAHMVNRLLEKNPGILNEYIDHLDPALIAQAVNEMNKNNPNFLSRFLKDLDTQALGDSLNTVLVDNQLFINGLLAEIDRKAIAGAANSAIKANSNFVNQVAAGLNSKEFAKSFNWVIYGQRRKVGTFVGAIDVDAIGVLVDFLIKEQPDKMAAMMNHLMKLARTSIYSNIEINGNNNK